MSFGYITSASYGRRVANQHCDFFTRGILVTANNGTGSEAVAARNRRRSNVPHVPWPEYDEVADWATSEGVKVSLGRDGTSSTPALESARLAAIDDISEDTGLPYFVVDENDEFVLDDNDEKQIAEVPPRVNLATRMHAVRLYRRRLSPDGTLGASAFGGAVRVSKYDPDVQNLLANYLRKGVA
ncbi:MAG: hypothetical protein AAGA65_09115 [Actinomycetota bacterium]